MKSSEPECEECEMRASDCACKGGPVCDWPEPEVRKPDCPVCQDSGIVPGNAGEYTTMPCPDCRDSVTGERKVDAREFIRGGGECGGVFGKVLVSEAAEKPRTVPGMRVGAGYVEGYRRNDEHNVEPVESEPRKPDCPVCANLGIVPGNAGEYTIMPCSDCRDVITGERVTKSIVHHLRPNPSPRVAGDTFTCDAPTRGMSTRDWEQVTCPKCLEKAPKLDEKTQKVRFVPGMRVRNKKTGSIAFVQKDARDILFAFFFDTGFCYVDEHTVEPVDLVEPVEEKTMSAQTSEEPVPAEPTEPWLIEPPTKKEARCPANLGGCGALVGYTLPMVQDPYERLSYIVCPACKRHIALKDK